MRLHRLAITGIGPFRDRQEIDFDDLASSGLFLIEGPTGSGKTTIIDAVVYALFGVVSAGDEESTRLRIRSHLCADTDPTGVDCEFSVDGRRFRITRVPAGFRDPDEPERRARSRGPLQVLTEFVPGHEPLVRTQRKDVAERISAVLGMTVDQFRQLVVLPQGRFAELLRQTPAERLRSLEPLLENGLLAAVQADLDARGQEARRRRAHADQLVRAAADQLQGRLAAWLEGMPPEVDFNDPAASDEARSGRIDDILAALGAEAERSASARDEQAIVAEARRAAAEQARQGWQLLDAVARTTDAVSRARAAADPADADLDVHAAQAQLGTLNQLTGSLRAHAAWEQQAQERHAEAEAARAEIDRLRRDLADRLAEQEPLPAEIERLQADRDAAAQAAARLAPLIAEEERLSDLQGKAAERDRAEAEVEDRRSVAAAAAAALTEAEAREAEAGAAWVSLVHRQRAASAVALAGLLTHGTPCPVCGSTEHPSPALDESGSGAVSDEDIAAAQAVLDEARTMTAQARQDVESTTAQLGTAQRALAALEGALGDLDLAGVTDRRETVSRQRADAESAREQVTELDRSIAATRDRVDAIRTLLEQDRTRMAELESALAVRAEAEEQRLTEIRALIGDAESATTLLASATERVRLLEELEKALGNLADATARVPDGLSDTTPADAERRASEKADEHRQAEALLSELTSLAATAAALRDESTPLAGQFKTAIRERARVQEETRVPLQLAALVTADNRLRLQLRSYALQRRFSAVLVAASRHLERMSAGKFSFAPSDSMAGAGQSGLGLTLLDSWTGQEQDPKSLSGGETFYAALALALGLADVVRDEAGGSALETLFVDEGFGSLDQDTLAQVLDQLDSLRAGNRVVGVVSHVTEMKESIPDRLEVRRREDRTSEIHRDRT